MLRGLWGQGSSARRARGEASKGGDLRTRRIKEPPMEIIGKCLTATEFVDYVEQMDFPEPRPSRIYHNLLHQDSAGNVRTSNRPVDLTRKIKPPRDD